MQSAALALSTCDNLVVQKEYMKRLDGLTALSFIPPSDMTIDYLSERIVSLSRAERAVSVAARHRLGEFQWPAAARAAALADAVRRDQRAR